MAPGMRFVHACVVAALLAACVSGPSDDLDGVSELNPGPPAGKADSAGIPALPVHGDYTATQAWVVTNQWEDTDTPDARAAGIAWSANSGLTWDQKYAAWVGSLQQIPTLDNTFTTVTISTPFGKSVPGPKLDCADLAILLRMSFAAWYHLPFYLSPTTTTRRSTSVTSACARRPARGTSTSNWSKYADYEHRRRRSTRRTGPRTRRCARAASPRATTCRTSGPARARARSSTRSTSNKRAARLILFTQAFLGSHNMVDSQNTYNLVPEALPHRRRADVRARADRRRPHDDRHARHALAPGSLQAEAIYGNDPPAQPAWQDPAETKSLFTDDEGGGPSLNTAYGGMTPYSHLNGGLKRLRVAKEKHGYWVNTWMDADEASWINDTDYDAIAARPARFAELLGSSDPAVERDQLLAAIAEKRAYLPRSPGVVRRARRSRERVREALHADAGQLRHDARDGRRAVPHDDRGLRRSRRSTTRTRARAAGTRRLRDVRPHHGVRAAAAGERRRAASSRPIFKLTANSYDPFAAFATQTGQASRGCRWTADESCAQAARPHDVVLPIRACRPGARCPRRQRAPPAAPPSRRVRLLAAHDARAEPGASSVERGGDLAGGRRPRA